jgi:hypothetical protein
MYNERNRPPARPNTIAREFQGMKLANGFNICIAIVILILTIVILVLISSSQSILNSVDLETGCNDNNPCTHDVKRKEGGCVFLPKETGDVCSSQCFETASDSTCQYFQLTRGFLTPLCYSPTVETCSGTCSVDGDCPQIASTVVGYTPLNGTCYGNVCYYTFNIDDLSGDFESSEIPPLTCNADDEVFKTFCSSKLDPTDPYVAEGCIIPEVQCESADVVDPPGTALVPICYYYFWCSIQQYIEG